MLILSTLQEGAMRCLSNPYLPWLSLGYCSLVACTMMASHLNRIIHHGRRNSKPCCKSSEVPSLRTLALRFRAAARKPSDAAEDSHRKQWPGGPESALPGKQIDADEGKANYREGGQNVINLSGGAHP